MTAVELLPVHAHIDDKALVDRGLTNYWGYNTIGFFAPDAQYSCSGATRRPGDRVQKHGAQPPRRRHRGDSRRGLQSHRRRQSPRPDAQFSRDRQPGLLPAHAGRSAVLHGFHRHRQHLQSAPSAHPPAGHGQPALLGERHARRRFSLRSRLHPGARRERGEQAARLLRNHSPGPGHFAGEADRRAVGRRRRRLSGRQFPGPLGGVERQIPRRGPQFLERRRRPDRASSLTA